MTRSSWEAMRKADALVEKAIMLGVGKRAEGYHDDKMLVRIEDIVTLLAAGAKPMGLNKFAAGGVYMSEVVYYGFWFMAADYEPHYEVARDAMN